MIAGYQGENVKRFISNPKAAFLIQIGRILKNEVDEFLKLKRINGKTLNIEGKYKMVLAMD